MVTTLTPEQVKERKEALRRYNLHVSLIEVAEECPKPKAQFLAWLEGDAGLKERLVPKQAALPLEPVEPAPAPGKAK